MEAGGSKGEGRRGRSKAGRRVKRRERGCTTEVTRLTRQQMFRLETRCATTPLWKPSQALSCPALPLPGPRWHPTILPFPFSTHLLSLPFFQSVLPFTVIFFVNSNWKLVKELPFLYLVHHLVLILCMLFSKDSSILFLHL